jgi:hypothetical protein
VDVALRAQERQGADRVSLGLDVALRVEDREETRVSAIARFNASLYGSLVGSGFPFDLQQTGWSSKVQRDRTALNP